MKGALDALKEINKSLMSVASTNIARIAIIFEDKDVFRNTDHYCRIIMEEYADDVDALTFIINCYKEDGYWEWFDVPGYVWESATVDTIQIIIGNQDDEKHYKSPEYHRCKREVCQFLGYYGECGLCGKNLKKDNKKDYCNDCSTRFT